MNISMQIILSAALLAWPMTALAGRSDMVASDYVRDLHEIVDESSEIISVEVKSATAGGCKIAGANGLIAYAGKVHEFLKGDSPGESIRFCGFSGLSINQTYLIMFDPPKEGVRFFSPDAVFLEFLPGEYYRLLSYESAEYTIGKREALVHSFKEGAISDLMAVLRQKK